MEEQNTKEQVESSQHPVDEPVQEPQKFSFLSSKWLKVGIGAIIVLALLGGVYFLGQNTQKQENAVVSSPSPSPIDETADWKTYKNSRFNFTFKLPQEFNLRQELNENRNIEATQETALYQVVIFDSPGKEQSLIINLGENSNFPTNESYREFIKKNHNVNGEFKDLTVDGVNALTYTALAGGPGQEEPDYHVVVELARNSKTYSFSLDSNKSDGPQEKLLKDILSTLKFTDSTSSSETVESFLEIPEYGVKFALSENIKDAYYIFETINNRSHAVLRVHSLDSERYCNEKLKDGYFGIASLNRVPKDEIDERTGRKFSDSGTGSIVKNYYYFVELSQAVCSQNSSNQAIETNARKAFGETSKTITAL